MRKLTGFFIVNSSLDLHSKGPQLLIYLYELSVSAGAKLMVAGKNIVNFVLVLLAVFVCIPLALILTPPAYFIIKVYIFRIKRNARYTIDNIERLSQDEAYELNIVVMDVLMAFKRVKRYGKNNPLSRLLLKTFRGLESTYDKLEQASASVAYPNMNRQYSQDELQSYYNDLKAQGAV